MPRFARHAGFTLIELSIVLVIIGLIVGGILVGQDLIHAAEIRATVKQIEQLDTAMNTFKNKYNCLPGDCANATNLGFTLNNGDGDEYIDYTGANSAQESSAVPAFLQQAGLYVTDAMETGSPGIYVKMPAFSISGNKARWTVSHMGRFGFFANMLIKQEGHYYWANTNNSGPNHRNVFMPIDAYALDVKLDDGMPLSGKMFASGDDNITVIGSAPLEVLPIFNTSTDEGAAGRSSNFCVTNDTPNLYNVLNTSRADGSLCTALVRSSF